MDVSRPRLRWFKYWSADELGYAELAWCSLEAQGLFGRLRAYLHTVSEPYGYLGETGDADYVKKLAFAIRVAPETLARMLAELEKSGVLARDGSGKLFSPWMVEREGERQSHAERGRSGGLKTAQAVAQAKAQAPAEAHGQARAEAGPTEPLKHLLKDRVRARASSSSSSSSSSEGVKGEEPLPPHVPTLEEFVAHFMADGIPEDYLEEQWTKFEANHDWLTKGGELRDFRLIVRGRWKKDEARYWSDKRDKENRDPVAGERDRETRKHEIERALETERDPARRLALGKELKTLFA